MTSDSEAGARAGVPGQGGGEFGVPGELGGASGFGGASELGGASGFSAHMLSRFLRNSRHSCMITRLESMVCAGRCYILGGGT